MAGTTQYFGVTYPTDTDYVKDGANAIETVADGFDAAVAIPTYNTQTGLTYTFVLLDAAKVTTSNNASAVTFTVPPQASVVWETGTTLTVANYGAGAVTIAGGAGVTITNAAATVAQFGSASIIRTGSDAWTVIPFAGGVALLSDSAISGTTGSPTTATYTDGGTNYKTYKFTGTGSITLDSAGLVDILLVGAGGGGAYANGSGGGGGGAIIQQQVFLTTGICGVRVGAGGANSGTAYLAGIYGAPSSIGVGTNVHTYISPGGGGAGSVSGGKASYGASGGGGGSYVGAGAGIILTGLGNVGGNGTQGGNGGGGGGGAGAPGTNSSGNNSGSGGNGLANTFIDGVTSVYYAGGGAGWPTYSGTNGLGGGGSANTGGGGIQGAAGGSGLVVIRVKA